MKAAGVVIVAKDPPAFLLLRRTAEGDHAGEWALPGGKLEDGESWDQAARREVREETGIDLDPPRELTLLNCLNEGGVEYVTFFCQVRGRPAVTLNGEHDGYVWATEDSLPSPLHPALEKYVDSCLSCCTGPEIRSDGTRPDIDTELKAAEMIRDGLLPSPWRYLNVHLFAVRITGTGKSYRPSIDEHVYRPPEHYLCDEFLRRCNGLPLIVDHPSSSLLDNDAFQDRVIGTVLLPYIKGDEVWGIAKVFDDKAAELMQNHQLSTSPSVAFKHISDTSRRELDEGGHMLIEDKPNLLDHLAVCEIGVWDKGGDPAGVLTTHQGGSPVADAQEVKNDAAEESMDALLERLKGINARLDAAEAARADDAAEESVHGGLLERLKTLNARLDAAEAARADDAKEELGEEASEEKAAEDEDAASGEGAPEDAMNGKEYHDAEPVKAAADAAKAARADAAKVRKMVADLERRIAGRMKRLEDANKEPPPDVAREMSAARADADAAFAAFGDSAPTPMRGERVVDYKRRCARSLQQHSPTWKGVDLHLLPPDALAVAVSQVYADAVKVAASPASIPQGQLRERVAVDATGRRITSFDGTPGAWMSQFTAGSRRVESFNNRGTGV